MPLFARRPSAPVRLVSFFAVMILILAGLISPGVHPALAVTITVLNLNDSGSGSLRSAIANANSATSAIMIAFDPALNGTIILSSGELGISTLSYPVTIDGGSKITIDGDNLSRVFDIGNNEVVTLTGLVIQNGHVAGDGGGIFNNGLLTINNSVLQNNNATSGGGGIANYSTTIINHTTLYQNSAQIGGGVYNYLGETLTINTTYLLNNLADLGGGVNNYGTTVLNADLFASNSVTNQGGAIWNYDTMTLSNSTLSGNSAANGGGIFNDGWLTIANSTLAAVKKSDNTDDVLSPVASDVLIFSSIATNNQAADVTDFGNNLFGYTTDPALGSLANNGGPTYTRAITASSPAYQKGDCGGNGGRISSLPPIPVVTIDQRGAPRKMLCDIGAYEVAALPTATSPATLPATSPATLPATSPATLPATSPATLPATSPATLPATSPATLPATSPATLPATSPATLPATSPATLPATLISTPPAASATPQLTIADPLLAKVADLSLAQPGEVVHFTLTVTNSGTGTAPNVIVTDGLPSLLTIQAATTTQGTFVINQAANTVIFSVGGVNPGQMITLTVSAIVSGSAKPPADVINTATLSDGEGHTSTASAPIHITAGVLPATGEHPAGDSGSITIWIGLLATVILSLFAVIRRSRAQP